MYLEVIVFDLGGTLMEFKDMPHSWINYYYSAFLSMKNSLGLSISDNDIKKSCKILKEYNPRVSKRELEYSPIQIFTDVTSHWNAEIDIGTIIFEFFKGLDLSPVIFDDTIQCLQILRKSNYKLAVLTDLPTAMPDEMMKNNIKSIINEIDLYVSSLSCGYRKPNPYGLKYIAEYYNITTDNLLFVGDEEKDIKTAQNANCKSVLIARNENKNFGQNFTIVSLNELFSVLHR